VKYIWNNSYLNCGCRWKWRMIIALNFHSSLHQWVSWWVVNNFCVVIPLTRVFRERPPLLTREVFFSHAELFQISISSHFIFIITFMFIAWTFLFSFIRANHPLVAWRNEGSYQDSNCWPFNPTPACKTETL